MVQVSKSRISNLLRFGHLPRSKFFLVVAVMSYDSFFESSAPCELGNVGIIQIGSFKQKFYSRSVENFQEIFSVNTFSLMKIFLLNLACFLQALKLQNHPRK